MDKKTEDFLDLLNKGSVIPYFQPIKNLKDNKIYKYEALCRIKYHDEIINPFIMYGENHNKEVYNKILESIVPKIIEKMESNTFDISINLTRDDLMNDSIIRYLIEKFTPNDFGKRIIFEITEGEEINKNDLSSVMEKLRESLSCRFALDDYGKGYSNITYITNINFEYIKLDGSIVKDIKMNMKHEYIVQMFIKLFTSLNSKIIAEFVCDKEVEDKLKKLNAHYGQGYYIGEPSVNFKA